MKNKITWAFLLLAAIVFGGCEKSNPNTQKQYTAKEFYVELIEVDSCEYIVSFKVYAISTIHKQNCKFCATRIKNNLLPIKKETI